MSTREHKCCVTLVDLAYLKNNGRGYGYDKHIVSEDFF